jgi:hypothetical protein
MLKHEMKKRAHKTSIIHALFHHHQNHMIAEKERRTNCQSDYQNEIAKLAIHPHAYVELMKVETLENENLTR